jgi:hypothetical protein
MFKAPGREDASLVDRLGRSTQRRRALRTEVGAQRARVRRPASGGSATVHRPAEIRPPAGCASICMPPTVGPQVFRHPIAVHALCFEAEANWADLCWTTKFELARPLTTRLCFSCYVWRGFAGICRPEPAHTSAPVDKLPLNRMPSTSKTGFKDWLQRLASSGRSQARSCSDQDSCLAATKITSASLDRRPAVQKKLTLALAGFSLRSHQDVVQPARHDHQPGPSQYRSRTGG